MEGGNSEFPGKAHAQDEGPGGWETTVSRSFTEERLAERLLLAGPAQGKKRHPALPEWTLERKKDNQEVDSKQPRPFSL